MILIPERKRETHKGTYGHLFIVGGSPGLTGAVCLASLGALRAGCGLVTAGVPEGLNSIFEVKLTEAMSRPLPESPRHVLSPSAVTPCLEFLASRADGLVIGPGISTHPETAEFFRQFFFAVDKPSLVDADGLKLLALHKKLLKGLKFPAIITPHPGEMSALCGISISEIQRNREKTAKSFSEEYNVIVVLKGYQTVVTDGRRVYINPTGNPGMATGGTGDVLSGVIGGLLVQGIAPYESAVLGTYIHGLAGDLAARKYTEYSLIASDIIEFIPEAFKRTMKTGLQDTGKRRTKGEPI
jgi:NAD(P)H-hydrate epimerase